MPGADLQCLGPKRIPNTSLLCKHLFLLLDFFPCVKNFANCILLYCWQFSLNQFALVVDQFALLFAIFNLWWISLHLSEGSLRPLARVKGSPKLVKNIRYLGIDLAYPDLNFRWIQRF